MAPPIAIVGMACRFPGASSLEAFWELLRAGTDAVREVPPDRWDAGAFHDPDIQAPGKSISRWGGFLDQVDGFDWRALGLSPREALHMDPQHRLMLEVAWEGLEDAGIPFDRIAGTRTGVFAGIMWSDYFRMQTRQPERIDAYTMTGNCLAFAANRVSAHFDLRGPSIAMDVGCASSLMAVHLACRSLQTGECDLAIAGGVNLLLTPDSYVTHSKAGVLSPVGRCKAFDASADGFVPGEGAGVVVLRPLAAALEAGDRIYAVIRGSAANHNGRSPWIMIADAAAQEDLLRRAFRDAEVEPDAIDYVELHGTGTRVGDPLEARALGAALGRRPRPCIVGSVKTNIGHLESAGSVAHLIKVALALWHRTIPPSLHLQQVNPAIPLAELGLVVQQAAGPWPDKDGPRIAGVTSLSLGGGNAHVVVQEAPRPPAAAARAVGDLELLVLSARAPAALEALEAAMAAFLARAPGPLHDVCYTAATRRTHHAHRIAVLGRTAGEMARSLLDGTPAPPPDNAREAALHGAAAAYRSGAAVDWASLYPDGRCVSLPPYPWQRERLWFEAPPAGATAAAHPQLGTAVDLAHAPGQRVWQKEVRRDSSELAYLDDHRIAGAVVLPATACLALAAAAAREAFPGRRFSLSGVELRRPLVFTDGEPARILQLVIDAAGADRATFRLFSGAGADWLEHATGVIQAAGEEGRA